MNYFDLEEFLDSETALSKKIKNLPSWTVIDNLKSMLPSLNDMRREWGSAINVTSGYRSEKLNKAVGGVNTSAHLYGLAVDIVPANGKFDEFVDFLKKWASDKDFDQIIIETKGSSRWIHYAYRNRLGEQRRKIFDMYVV